MAAIADTCKRLRCSAPTLEQLQYVQAAASVVVLVLIIGWILVRGLDNPKSLLKMADSKLGL